MTSSEGKDTATQLEKRKQSAKEVKVQFIDPENFNVIDNEGNVKYIGKIDLEKSINDECTCPSFTYGMKYESATEDNLKGESRYMAENGTAFQCKHIIRAKNIRKLGMMEDS